MNEAAIRELVEGLRSGHVAPDDAVRQLRRLPFADLGFARVDHHRALRLGRPEAVYARGKTPAQCVAIIGELLAEDGPVVLSRADPEQVKAVTKRHPGALVSGTTVVWRPAGLRPEQVVVVTAGTSDLPVAEEAKATLRAYGWDATLIADVGVAGLHRLLARVEEIQCADAVVVVAGMEGALGSVVGGLTAAPVVAVPT
ncbi:MAG: AIR carboxylase family protein, partial [Acidimicrobiaceae bacterium]|nr:AIR carboxylase family protein [Acidimicrobiaceae bacterium]